MSSTPFQAVDRTNAAEAVRAQLFELITSGQLGVGTKLPSENELARSFGVSRPVLREALGSLRAMGLVASHVGRGSFVSSARPTPHGLLLGGRYSIEELHEVRSQLEIPGAALAARRRTARDLEELARLVALQADCDEPSEWVKLDVAFHVALAGAAGNRVLATLIEDLRDLQVEQSFALAHFEGRLVESGREHGRILAAVNAQSEARAAKEMRSHLNRIRQLSLPVSTYLPVASA
jgi:GntR family transcriptional regulator, transcriptional repressor for pyruvate dehydrogenase complex